MPESGWAYAPCAVALAAKLCIACLAGTTSSSTTGEPAAVITSTRQLRELVPKPDSYYSLRIEGTVLWVNTRQGRLVLGDEAGLAELELELPTTSLAVTDRVRLTGNCIIFKRSGRAVLVPKGPVIDNDGVHGTVERFGTVYLEAGLQPFRLTWFNGQDQLELAVEIEGPNFARQPIPSNMLFWGARIQPTHTTGIEPGVWYECVDAFGETLPDFDKAQPINTGHTGDLDLRILPRTNQIAVRFTGYLKVPWPGLYKFYLRSDDGSQLFIGNPPITVDVIGTNMLPLPRRISPGQALGPNEEIFWAETEGRIALVRVSSDLTQMELTAGGGKLQVDLVGHFDTDTANLRGCRLHVVGVCCSATTADGQRVAGRLLVGGTNQIVVLPAPASEQQCRVDRMNGLPVLDTAVEVHKLKRDEAQRAYRVKLGGVVTCVLPEHQAFTIQDSTRGIYVVDMTGFGRSQPEVGEYVQVEGVTDPGLFAPVINATRVVSAGPGLLPEPVQPTWDQLLNGSMDAQYVQIQGIVTDVRTNTVTLHMRDGSIEVHLRPNNVGLMELPTLRDALLRIRGCLFASWDYVTHQVKPGEIRIYNADIFVDEPAPVDVFGVASKKIAELLQFDPLAGAFQRVKVEGQIIANLGPVFFIMQDGFGMRFIPRTNLMFQPGDTVEVVGFPDVVAACSPTLREAVARKTGHAPLPQPRWLGVNELLDAANDATRVRVEATLVGIGGAADGQTLELQTGVRTFVARIAPSVLLPRNLVQGSRLEITGVYIGRGNNRVTSPQVSSFELLINSPENIRVLARPPWWTLERLLIVIGVLLCVLCVAALWITMLHRKVEQRTAELTTQIQQRQRAEHRQWLERERTRIAQDLHDELGAGITEISMLALRAGATDAAVEKRAVHLEQIRARATELVIALDEIVWATNPKHDSLTSLVSYFSLYADRFLGAANIRCRIERDQQLSDRPLASHMRHELFMVFREALNNVVKHARATEVTIWFGLKDSVLQITVADNGQGMNYAQNTARGEGLANMRARIERLTGVFDVESALGKGTQVKFAVPIGSQDV